jgi:hypothetical protein
MHGVKFKKNAKRRAAITAEPHLSAATAVSSPALCEKLGRSIGSNGGASLLLLLGPEFVLEAKASRLILSIQILGQASGKR